jgi:hypothetical protein
MIGQKLFDKQEAAQILHVSISTLDHDTAARRIGHLKLGKRCYYTQADLEGYMQSRRVEPAISEKERGSKASAPAAAPRRRMKAAAGAA